MNDTLRFDNPEAAQLLWVVVALAALGAWSLWRRHQVLRRVAEIHLLSDLTPTLSRGRQACKIVLAIGALAAVTLALLGPRWGERFEEVQRRGLDVVFALDVSRSMLAEDLTPNRLERAKQYIRDVVEVLGGDRIGLVTFAGDATLACPLTIDYGSFRMSLEEVGPRSRGRGGTLIGDAIRIATAAFVDEVKDHKAIVILSDGEDQDSFPVEAATTARQERGVRIYTIGLGDMDEGQRIPITTDGQTAFLQHDGQEVWSRMDGTTLRAVAEAGGGAYVPAGLLNLDMAEFYDTHIAGTERRAFESNRVRQFEARYQWFAGLALILLLIDMLLLERRRSLAARGGRAVRPGSVATGGMR